MILLSGFRGEKRRIEVIWDIIRVEDICGIFVKRPVQDVGNTKSAHAAVEIKGESDEAGVRRRYYDSIIKGETRD